MKLKLNFSLLIMSGIFFLLALSCEKDNGSNKDDTNSLLPVLSTAEVTEVTQTTATCGGTITSDGGTTVVARGVCWSTNQTPTTEDSKTTDGAGAGTFTSFITGLSNSTTYYVRAYATNNIKTGYGSAMSFTTLKGPGNVTDIDGNIYNTVTIGTQEWMAENLKVTHYRNGDAIGTTTPATLDISFYSSTNKPKYQWAYYGEESYVTTYGRLYTWYAITDSRNVCPNGWHIPTDAEWKTLEMYLGMNQSDADETGSRGTVEGGKLKETGTTHWRSPNNGATNESGFTALPGGTRTPGGAFINMGIGPEEPVNGSGWWSCTEYSTGYAWVRGLYNLDAKIGRDKVDEANGLYVRCIKD